MSERDDEYPTDEELERIMGWPLADAAGMLDFIRPLWWCGDWGWSRTGKWLHLSTGGWSGNEDIIAAMQKNTMFWMFCWEASRRGGHYKFDLSRLPQSAALDSGAGCLRCASLEHTCGKGEQK